MSPRIKAASLYALGLAIMLPAYLDTWIRNAFSPPANQGGCCGYLSFWDFYLAIFMVIAFTSFLFFFMAGQFAGTQNKWLNVCYQYSATLAVMCSIPATDGFIAVEGALPAVSHLFGFSSTIFLGISAYLLKTNLANKQPNRYTGKALALFSIIAAGVFISQSIWFIGLGPRPV